MGEPLDLPADFAASDDRAAFLDRLRGHGPVTRVRPGSGPDLWVVTSHQHVLAALADRRLSSEARYAREVLLADAPADAREDDGDHFGGSMLTTDPPDHTRLRGLVARAFTARRVTALRPRIQQITDALLDELAPAGEADLLAAFALPLPLRVICALLGVPDTDHALIRTWSDALFAEPVDDAAVRRVLAVRTALREYLADLVDRKQREPGDDLLSALCHAATQDRLTRDELANTGVLLLVAGHETTAGLIAATVLRLLTRPEELGLIRRDPTRLTLAIEEVLRFDGAVVLGVVRYTTEEVELAGTRIPAGQPVLLCTPSANRDPARFDRPAELDLARADNPHLSFGHGIHFCLGAPLARAEAEIALGTLLRRFPDLALAVPAQQVRWRSGAVRRLAALPVVFTPRPGAPRRSASAAG